VRHHPFFPQEFAMRVKRVGFLSLLVMLAAAREAAAQDPPQPQQIQLVSNGQPLSGIAVSGFLNRINKPIDETGNNGEITIPADALNTITKGTQVAVWVVTCRDGVVTEVILIRVEDEDGDNPSKHHPERIGEECRCERKGVFVWGDGPVTVNVDPGGGVLQTPIEEFDVGDDGGFSGYLLGKWELRHFYRWEHVSGDDPSVAQHDAASTANGFGGYLGFKLGDTPLWAMAGGYINWGLETNTTLANGNQIDGKVTNYALGGGVRLLFNTDRPLNPYLWAGGFRNWNDGKFTTRVGQVVTEEERTYKDWTKELGFGVTYWVKPRWALDVGLSYNGQFDAQNADENVRFSVGGGYNFGKICGGQCGGRR
jgi:hypothetical protein